MKQILKLAGLASALAITALAGANVAHAQPSADTFIYQSQNSSSVDVGGGGSGPSPYTASYLTGTSEATFADGSTRTGSYTCVAMSQPPQDKLFDVHMLCDVTDSEGSYTATIGCTVIDAVTTDWSCIGGLYGTEGAYEGRRGTITDHTVGNAATGTGQWYR